jgi:tetratricopeptide (TPR) repeat protein
MILMSSLIHHLFPQGIDSTVQRQLKRLPESMQPLLKAAAVAGSQIDQALLGQLIGQLGLTFSLNQWLVQSVSAAILEIEAGQSRFADESLRLGLLEKLSDEERMEWHAQIITALEALYPDDPAYAATLATHWGQLGNATQEQRYARLAGEYAGQQHHLDTAVCHFSRALFLTPNDNLPELYTLLLAREKIYHTQGNRDAQKDDLTRLAEIADQLSTESGEEWRTQVALRLGAFAEVTGEYTVAIVAATEALRLAEATEMPAYEAGSYLLWGQALLRQGKYAQAEEKLQMSRAQAKRHQMIHIEADSLRFLGVHATDVGQFDQARQYYEAALPLYRNLGDKQGESTLLNNLSIVAYSQNQLLVAMDHWEQASLIHEAIGDKAGTARVLSNLSAVCLDLGEFEKGRAYSQKALTLCREADLRFGQGMNLINLSLFSAYLQADDQAEIYSQAALTLAKEMKSLPLEGLALKDRAYILQQQRQWDEAAQTYQQAMAIWQELAQPLQLLEVQAGLARVALRHQDLAQAQRHIQPVLAHLQAGQTPMGASRPFFIYLVCYEVLAATDASVAAAMLQQAHEALMLFANEITDASQREAFFQNVEEHQQLTMLFNQGG